LKDRERCEVSFIARLVYIVIIGGLKCSTQKQHIEMAEFALQAATEPFLGLDSKRANTLRRRVVRMEDNTIKPMTGKAHGEKVLLVIYFFINELIDKEYLNIPEECKLRIIVDTLLKLLDTKSESMQSRLPSAKKQAEKWLVTLQSEGYYQIE
jgi:hypothetical protein